MLHYAATILFCTAAFLGLLGIGGFFLYRLFFLASQYAWARQHWVENGKRSEDRPGFPALRMVTLAVFIASYLFLAKDFNQWLPRQWPTQIASGHAIAASASSMSR